MSAGQDTPTSPPRPGVRLRPFDRGDIPTLLDWVDSPEFLLQWAGRTFVWPLDEAQLEAYLQSSLTDPPARHIFAAIDETGGAVVGHIGLRDICRIHGGAMVTCVLVGEAAGRSRGIGTSMMEAICEIGFERLGLHRLELLVFDFNRGAIRCYERAGFRIEGLMREKFRMGDAYWNSCVMSQLRSDWDARRAARS